MEFQLIDEEYAKAMLEMEDHNACVAITQTIYKNGLLDTLYRLADYCEDSKEAYALLSLAKHYKENERGFCENAPTMQ